MRMSRHTQGTPSDKDVFWKGCDADKLALGTSTETDHGAKAIVYCANARGDDLVGPETRNGLQATISHVM